MPEPRSSTRLALALLAATCLTPVSAAQAAPGNSIGPEFQVNTFTTGSQYSPAVAMDADGDFVVVWQNCSIVTGDMVGTLEDCRISAQQYDAIGRPQGLEFQINSNTSPDIPNVSTAFNSARVAMDADGDFVVVWLNNAGDADRIFVRRFDAAGTPRGGEVQVKSHPTDILGYPAIAMDADGGFVVAWQSRRRESGTEGIFAQRFGAAGTPQGGEIQIKSHTTDRLGFPEVAMDADGDFVVVWWISGQGGSYQSVIARQFDAEGKPQGDEFLVNEESDDGAWSPAVAMDADGDFVVVWDGRSGIFDGIYARRFDAAGEPQSPDIRLDNSSRYTSSPGISMNSDGAFVVVWEGRIAGGNGPVARLFGTSHNSRSEEFLVQQYGHEPAVAMDADGDFVVAWDITVLDGDYRGIFAQRFQGAERVEGDFDGDGNADLLWRNAVTGTAVVWLMDGETRVDEGSIGTVPLAWQIAGTGDFNGDGRADILWRHSATGTAVIWQMNGLEKAASGSIGKPPLAWAIEQVRDTDGDGLSDIVWRHASTGSTLVWRMSGFTKVSAAPIGSVNADWQLR